METVKAPDAEDIFALPPHLTRGAVPRRGVGVVKAPRPKKDTDHLLRALIAGQEARIAATVADSGTELPLAAEVARPEFGDVARQTPLGAAVAAAFLLGSIDEVMAETVVDAWVGARGVVFAVEALLELGSLSVTAWHSRIPTLRRGGAGFHPAERRVMAVRAKAHLVAADDADYAAAMAAAEEQRGDRELSNALASFLFPERTDWVEVDIATIPVSSTPNVLPCTLLAGAVSTAAQGVALANWIRWGDADLPTLFAVLGTDVTPVLRRWLQAQRQYADEILAVLSHVPTDDAFDAVVEFAARKQARVLLSSMAARFPGRAVRRLAEAADRPADAQEPIDQLLRLRVLAAPDVARAVLPGLSHAARARVEKHLKDDEAVPAADPATLPALLAAPPWRGRKVAEPVVVKGLTSPAGTTLTWLAGEREEWSRDRLPPFAARTDWSVLARTVADGRSDRLSWFDVARFVLRAPEDMVRPLLPMLASVSWQSGEWVPEAVVRFGVDLWPVVAGIVKADPAGRGYLLLPFEGPEIALYWADALARLKTARPAATAWFRRHPAAARFLIPAALGRSGPARRGAETALVWLAATGHATEVETAAAAYGEAASAAIKALTAEPLAAVLPAKMPAIPLWAQPFALPSILLADRRSMLPPEAVTAVIEMVAISTPEAMFPGLDVVRELCDARSLAAFSWALFEQWEGQDAPGAQRWTLDSMRWFGDDDCVRRLVPLIREWPGRGQHQRAVTGLDVLAAIGGDTALLHLLSISQKAKFRGLRDEAAARIRAIADELRLTPDQMADRLVPDLGLDEQGTMTLDYGPRSFVVGFDELLKPYVIDQAGKVLKALPKPGAKDDPEVAPASAERFAGLKKDARTLASDQIRRCELAMVNLRRWTAGEFARYFVGHPLIRHIARRLVWGDFAPDGTLRATFRVAEDLSFADVEDEVFDLPADACVGIVHPVDLGAELPRWSELFADYAIVQPFAQLGRPVLALTEQEAAQTRLDRFAAAPVPALKVVGLERRGWRRSDPADAGGQNHMLRDLPDGRIAVVDLDPGLWIGALAGSPDQRLEAVWISEAVTYTAYMSRSREAGTPLASLGPVAASEILRDLTEVTTP